MTAAGDGLGLRRKAIDPDSGDEIERLDLSAALIEHPEFVSALAERVARLAAVRHTSYTTLRRLDRPSADRLELVSTFTPGWRLSDLLAASREHAIPLDITVIIGLLRQLLPAVALYGRNNREAAIGTLAVERLIVTPQARLVIAEHAFGPAVEKLNLGRDRLWRDLRVAMPPSAGLPRANQRADANALGVVALSLLLGRPLEAEEYPSQLQSLADGLSEWRDGTRTAVSAALGAWLSRALQFDVRNAFQTPGEAQLAFETVLASDRAYVTSSAKLEEWVAHAGALLTPPPVHEVTSSSAVQQVPLVEPDAPVTLAAPAHVERLQPAAAAPARRTPLYVLGALVVILLAVIAWQFTRDTGQPRAGEGELVVDSRPPGAKVIVDGRERGVTPATVRLPSGAHVLEVLVGEGEPRVIPLMIRAGVQTAQYVELQVAKPLSPAKAPAEKKGRR
ncbi:MAG TPA: PEGA domain-containing protein [Vicinamibacterales bacterium]|nr:PEGA domain-containing protein [Vicinamibacterales bacterium]